MTRTTTLYQPGDAQTLVAFDRMVRTARRAAGLPIAYATCSECGGLLDTTADNGGHEASCPELYGQDEQDSDEIRDLTGAPVDAEPHTCTFCDRELTAIARRLWTDRDGWEHCSLAHKLATERAVLGTMHNPSDAGLDR